MNGFAMTVPLAGLFCAPHYDEICLRDRHRVTKQKKSGVPSIQ